MTPFNNPEAENFFQVVATAINLGSDKPEQLLKIFPLLCEHSKAMTRLLSEKTLH